jgi:hypothetical protein
MISVDCPVEFSIDSENYFQLKKIMIVLIAAYDMLHSTLLMS